VSIKRFHGTYFGFCGALSHDKRDIVKVLYVLSFIMVSLSHLTYVMNTCAGLNVCQREKERVRKNQDSNLTHTHRLAYTLANRPGDG
jgi:hypothetical protein